MTLDNDGPFGSRLRALDVPVPAGLGPRLAAAAQHQPPPPARHPTRRLAFVAAGVAGILIANAAALYMAPAYSLALAKAPVAGGASQALLAAAGLSASDGTTPIGSTASVDGKRVILSQATVDAQRTVLFFDVPNGYIIDPRQITVSDQFGHRLTDGPFFEAYSGAVMGWSGIQVSPTTDGGSDMPVSRDIRKDQLVLILPAVTGEAAKVGARLTVRIDELAPTGAARPTQGKAPWGKPISGPWTLNANLVVQSASPLPVPGPATVDGTTWTLSSVSQAGGILEVKGSVSGPEVQRFARDHKGPFPVTSNLGGASAITMTYSGNAQRFNFDLTFSRPRAGTTRLTIGQATFTITAS